MEHFLGVCGIIVGVGFVCVAAAQEKEEKRTIHEMTGFLLDTKTKGFAKT